MSAGFEGIFGRTDIDRTGVWAVATDQIYTVHETEVEALRLAVRQGYGEVLFIKWGQDLYEARREQEEQHD